MSKFVPLNGFGRVEIEKEYITIIEDSTLNFNIQQYATEEELVAAQPKENTIGVVTDTEIHAWNFSVTEPQMSSNNKNLLVYPYSQTTKTHNGVTFTDNGDGTITANGTATDDAYFYLIHPDKTMKIEGGTYALTGCPAGGSNSTYILRVYDNSTGSYWEDTGDGRIRELSTNGMLDLVCFIRVKSGITANNLVFTPQFEKGSVTTPYVKGDASGQVWIITDTSSSTPFNALKKNGITVYPVSAKQYINGAWADVIAKNYQNNTWIQFSDNRYYLFKSGEGAVVPLKTYRESKATISVTTDNISTAASSNEYCYASARTENTIDLSDYSKMRITYTAAEPEWGANIIGVTSKAFTNGDAQPSNGVSYAATTEIGQTTNATTATLDISTINESLYCAFYYCGTMTITEWWLE